MNFNLAKVKKFIDINSILFFILLCMTQLNIKIPNKISVSGLATVQMANIVLIFIGFYFILYKLILKKEYENLSQQGKRVFKLSIILIIYFIFSILLRYLLYKTATISINMTLTILLAVEFYLLIDRGYFKYLSIIDAIITFMTIINLYIMFHLLVIGDSIRNLEVLGNINVYVGMTLLFSPLILYRLLKKKCVSLLKKSMFFFNCSSFIIFLILSGSRFAFLYYCIEISIIYIIIYKFKFNSRRIVKMSLIAMTVILVIGITYLNNGIIKEDINRTFNIFIKNSSLNIDKTQNDNKNVNDKVYLNSSKTYFSKNINRNNIGQMNNQVKLLTNVKGLDTNLNLDGTDDTKATKSLTRNILYSQSISEIKSHMFLGKGSNAVNIEGWGYQSPHNYFLEILLCYGIFGGIIYILLATYLVVNLFFRRNETKENKLFILGYCSLLLFSMVEPLMSDKIVILLPMWAVCGGLLKIKLNNSSDDEGIILNEKKGMIL